MNALPDELVKKIYGYINPAFQYEAYIRNTNGYRDAKRKWVRSMADICRGRVSAAEQLDNTIDTISRSHLTVEYLNRVQQFLVENPLFVRPNTNEELTERQYKRQFDTEIRPEHLRRMEANIKIRRGEWDSPDEPGEVMLYNDILEVLHHGSIRTLMFSCITNNIHGFKEALKKNISRKIMCEQDIIHFIDTHYPITSPAVHSMRKPLLNKLMKL